MRGKEGRGFAIAVAAHVVIIGLLSVQWTAGERRFDNPPMEVDLIAETAVQSTAPVISETPPAARLGEEEAVDITAPEPMPAPPLPEPIVRPTPAPTPKQVAQPKAQPKQTPPAAAKAQPKAAPKAAPAKDRPARPTGRLDGIAEGLSKSQPKAPASKGAPAAAVGAQTQSEIRASINAKVRPYWNRCSVTGVDVSELVTKIEFTLTRAGKLAGFTSVTTTGQNDSNKPQVARHQECAKRAIELASPFDLSEEGYSFWQESDLTFFKR
ncbi:MULTISPECIES: hypothetical protein [unclassified Sphingopyxis]|uniref:hypothetical protein n=1 Tax=unclassified Sphingopyxis TaxID=2614943 RepID=UPI0028566F6F|nr:MULTISPECIES: hypothetical protein [unclassified Sphingopyxis]MDR6834470.1 outer membrane biosynthesis protein TonB [Sphingopyxis sp. BE122]MDR7226739.1 outer membrane biosynthesis protein TonB [Sphingopyxis sp. BE259]